MLGRNVVRSLVLVVSLSLLGVSAAGAAGARFSDTGGHWAEADISLVTAHGILVGYGDATYRPAQPVTRAELAKLLVCVLEGTERALSVRSRAATYADVGAGHWSWPWVERATDYGIFQGYGDGSFRPDVFVTRAEAAVAASRVVAVLGAVSGGAQVPGFSDAGAIPDWAAAAVGVCREQGLITGYPDGTFGPGRNVSRAEAAVIARRLMRWCGSDYHLVGTVIASTANGVMLATGTQRLVLDIGGARIFRNGRPFTGATPAFDQAGVVLGPGGRVEEVHLHFVAAQGTVKLVASRGSLVAVTVGVDGRELEFVIKPESPVFRNGRPVSPDNLRAGDDVYIVVDVFSGGARAVEATRFTAHGTIAGTMNDGAVLFITSGHSTFVIAMAPDAIVIIDGMRTTANALESGMKVAYFIRQGLLEYVEAQSRE
jgi:hypothetical protein